MTIKIDTIKRPVKNGYSSAKLHAKRDRKRAEAEARNAKWEGKTVEAKIKSLAKRRGASKKQLAKLYVSQKTI